MNGHADIKFIFKPFPLDGTCNPFVEHKGDGTRCKMAAWTLCAEKVSQKGWAVHTWYFDNQESLAQLSDMKNTNTELAALLGLNYDQIEQCSESVATYDEIKQSAAEAKNAKVEGTPSIYLNGKKLDYGQFPEVLRSAVNSL
jgi:protein-disulfide isomerase